VSVSPTVPPVAPSTSAATSSFSAAMPPLSAAKFRSTLTAAVFAA
jgi:hypothetical protein